MEPKAQTAKPENPNTQVTKGTLIPKHQILHWKNVKAPVLGIVAETAGGHHHRGAVHFLAENSGSIGLVV